jgi:hypothetical protein
MFVREKHMRGKTYFALVESVRVKLSGRVRQRVIASLGTCPTLEAAIAEAEQEIAWCAEHVEEWNEQRRAVGPWRKYCSGHGWFPYRDLVMQTERRGERAKARLARLLAVTEKLRKRKKRDPQFHALFQKFFRGVTSQRSTPPERDSTARSATIPRTGAPARDTTAHRK